jgi:hypothetical protein
VHLETRAFAVLQLECIALKLVFKLVCKRVRSEDAASHITTVLPIQLTSLQRLVRTASQSGVHGSLHVTRVPGHITQFAIGLYFDNATAQEGDGTRTTTASFH